MELTPKGGGASNRIDWYQYNIPHGLYEKKGFALIISDAQLFVKKRIQSSQ